MVKVLRNAEHNGIELYFDTKPGNNIIEKLKNLKFRWHNLKKCWFSKATAENEKFVLTLADLKNFKSVPGKQYNSKKNNDIVLTELEKLTEQEKNVYVVATYPKHKSMQEYLLKTYEYYKTKDNLVIEIRKASNLSLNKTMYYDDEYDAPQVNFENFKEYNKHNCNKYDYYSEIAKNFDYKKLYFCEQADFKNNKNVYMRIAEYDDGWKAPKYEKVVREMTQNELQDILTIYKKQKEDYNTRLEKYFARYKDHIYTCGYWANR